jgi:tetratricopeptide (TPR) repeat protein
VVDFYISGVELCYDQNLKIMKKLIVLLLLVPGVISHAQTTKNDKIPVTTPSKSALAYYTEAMKNFDDVALGKALNLLTKSLREDPDFFMANYQTAIYYSWFGNVDKFKEYATAASNCKAKLSPAEELLKSAITKLKENQTSDVTDIGRKLTAMYPKDPDSFGHLFYYQLFINDTIGGLETLKKELEITDNPAPVCNMLGYVYIGLKQYNEADRWTFLNRNFKSTE